MVAGLMGGFMNVRRVLARSACGALALMLGTIGAGGEIRAQDAGGGYYIGARAIGGVTEVRDETRTGAPAGQFIIKNNDDLVGVIGAVAGFSFAGGSLPVRVEAEYNRRYRFDFDTRVLVTGGGTVDYEVNLATDTVLLNGYYDFLTGTPVRFYIGGGVGLSRNVADTTRASSLGPTESDSRSETSITFAAMFGTQVRIGPRWIADLGYRVMSLGEFETPTFSGGDKVTAGRQLTIDLIFGLNYLF